MQYFDLQMMVEMHGVVLPLAILLIEDDEERAYIADAYTKYKGLMYKTAIRYFSNNQQELEDAIGDAVLNMCKYSKNICNVPAERLDKYIVCIVRNACNARCRRIYAQQELQLDNYDPAEMESVEDEDALIDVVMSKENALDILESFRRLSERDKELIRMRHIDMLEYDEIADILGTNLVVARTAVSRAKQRMVKIVKDGGQGLEM